MPDWVKLEPTHYITILSILASLLTFYLGWRKERRFARRQQGDQIRLAAANLVAKLERWREITLSLFDEVQAGFVEASELAARDPSKLDFIAARDYLWKEISRCRAAVRRQIILENIQTSHADLIAYCPGSRLQFLDVFAVLNTAEAANFERLLDETQSVVLGYRKSAAPYHSAQLGNDLRDCATRTRERFTMALTPVLAEAIATLNTMIQRNDEDLIFDRRGLTGASNPAAGDVSSAKPAAAT